MTETKPKVAGDLEQRVKDFNAELIPLLAKYNLGLSAQPLITPDGRIVARPTTFDDTKVVEEAEKATNEPLAVSE